MDYLCTSFPSLCLVRLLLTCCWCRCEYVCIGFSVFLFLLLQSTFCFCLLAFYLLKRTCLPAFGPRSPFFHGIPRCVVTESNQHSMGPAGKLTNIRQGDGSIEEYAGRFWEVARRSATEKTCLLVFFWGGLSEPFKSRMPYWNPEELLQDYVNLALRLSGSAFRVELAAEPAPFHEPTESAPEPAPFREPTESAPEPAPFREPTESAPEPAPFREPTESAPEPAPFREPTGSAPEPAPFREPTGSAPKPAPFREPTESAPEPAPFREPTGSAPEPAPFREPTQSAPEPAPFREPTQSAPEPAPFQEPTHSSPFREPTHYCPFQEPTHSVPVREPTHSAPPREPTESTPEPALLLEPMEIAHWTPEAAASAHNPPALPAPPWLPLSQGPLPLHGPGPPPSLPLLRPRSAVPLVGRLGTSGSRSLKGGLCHESRPAFLPLTTRGRHLSSSWTHFSFIPHTCH